MSKWKDSYMPFQKFFMIVAKGRSDLEDSIVVVFFMFSGTLF